MRLTGQSSQNCPEYCPSAVSWHLHLPHSQVPWPEHNWFKNSPHGVMQVSLEALHSHAVYPKTWTIRWIGLRFFNLSWKICLYDFLTFSKIYLDCPILNCKHIFRIGTPHDLLQNRALHCSGHTKSCRIRNNRQIQPTNNKYIEYGWKCSNSHIL